MELLKEKIIFSEEKDTIYKVNILEVPVFLKTKK